MNRSAIRAILVAPAILFASGCHLVLNPSPMNPADATVSEIFANTAAAQTLSAMDGGATQDPAIHPSATATLQSTPTFTPSITLTNTLEKVTVTVSKNTNCREGPDKFFDLVGIMKVGETAEAIGRNAPKTYWVIRLPSDTAKQCWLWYEWATVTGNGDALPVIQSPPTPTWSPKPDFSFYYVGLATCAAPKIIRLQIVNTGNIPWESFRVYTKDMVTSAEMSYSTDKFLTASDPGCVVLTSIPAIGPGETAYAFGLVMSPASSGHNIYVVLHLFTQDLGTGTHMSGDFTFTMP